ncbi:hypothetical protein [Rhodospirillaceae bacterium SYSU D60014]|uniref:hypothetical protein n=1 Tax=Virgifigura deserti TaxID=2268457 RepID=UPI0013C454A8
MVKLGPKRPPAASPQQYRLTRNSHGWTVQAGSDRHGPYLSRRDALLDAVDAAQAAGDRGASVEVVDCTARSGDVVLWRSDSGAFDFGKAGIAPRNH